MRSSIAPTRNADDQQPAALRRMSADQLLWHAPVGLSMSLASMATKSSSYFWEGINS
jgi:hypothetical protein